MCQLTDVGGRTVIIDRPEKWSNTSRKTLFQWIWYLRMVLACDENIQKLGIVNVVYCLDRYQRQDLETIRLFHSQLTPAIPLKTSARYAVFENKAWKQVLDFEQVIMKQPARMRFRSIQGKPPMKFIFVLIFICCAGSCGFLSIASIHLTLHSHSFFLITVSQDHMRYACIH